MTAYVRQATAVSSQRAMEVFERLNSLVNLVIGAANTVAGKTMFDAIERVRKTPYYRFGLKRHLREAERAYYAYEKLHIQNFGDRTQLFYDYLDTVEEDIQPHVDILRFSIKSLLDKYRQTETELKSYVETARNLLAYAVHLYDVQIKTADEAAPGIHFDKYMNPARLSRTLYHFEQAADMICKTEDGITIDLNKDANAMLAFRIIEKKLTSERFLNRVGYEALKLNPECRKYITDEDWNELESECASQV